MLELRALLAVSKRGFLSVERVQSEDQRAEVPVHATQVELLLAYMASYHSRENTGHWRYPYNPKIHAFLGTAKLLREVFPQFGNNGIIIATRTSQRFALEAAEMGLKS
ncbi:MAG: hypothetical protein A6F71_10745 [Cycloclasticus sp. symbiont of Poecilosclerida sp. M]|nr:MAG: hypothetical protein A6F71_10745 [Cycloclasticus sp. symbiont of Poecilosclerida sp. M]